MGFAFSTIFSLFCSLLSSRLFPRYKWLNYSKHLHDFQYTYFRNYELLTKGNKCRGNIIRKRTLFSWSVIAHLGHVLRKLWLKLQNTKKPKIVYQHQNIGVKLKSRDFSGKNPSSVWIIIVHPVNLFLTTRRSPFSNLTFFTCLKKRLKKERIHSCL